MRWREGWARLDRLQHTTTFKAIASVILVIVAIAGFSAYAVAVATPAQDAAIVQPEAGAPPAATPTPTPPPETPAPANEQLDETDKQVKSAMEAGERAFEAILAKRASPVSVGVAVGILTALALVVVWLGLALTYLGLTLAGAVVIVPLYFLSQTGWAVRTKWNQSTSYAQIMQNTTFLLTAVLGLTASFTASMQAARVLLSGANPVSAIARNALAEAVRMKISLVFIVVLIFLLAALPLLLDPTTPLRYRVQSFLQYGTGGTFWIIAALTLFFAAASVAFEQRDRQIWQTMTKPVAAWQYVLGKWVGVVTLAAVLLAVCSSGVFIFTEYLRQQPAEGEQVRQVTAAEGISEDRYILESQVLAARVPVAPWSPYRRSDPEFLRGVESFVEEQRGRDPNFARDPETRAKVESDLFKSLTDHFRSIPVGETRTYEFRGMADAASRAAPITLRYKIDSGANDPSDLYKLTFIVGNVILPPEQVSLGAMHNVQLPAIIDEQGVLHLQVVNGALMQDPEGRMMLVPNPDLIMFPKDGMEVFYSKGSYQANFARVAAVLWVKLAFLAMLAIAASTFLSFPVACLIAFSVFLAAEGSGFLSNSLEYYDTINEKGQVNLVKVVIRGVALSIAWMFKTYHSLKPTARLVDGRLLEWAQVVWGCGVLLVWTAILYAAGVGVFRKRELATYSGN